MERSALDTHRSAGLGNVALEEAFHTVCPEEVGRDGKEPRLSTCSEIPTKCMRLHCRRRRDLKGCGVSGKAPPKSSVKQNIQNRTQSSAGGTICRVFMTSNGLLAEPAPAKNDNHN